MLKKTIQFKDLDGNDVAEDFYFNLNKAELAEMELSYKGGLTDYLQKMIDKEDGGEIIAAFKDIIRKSVGVRSEDGRRFIKNDDIANDFMQTEAYSELFMQLVTNSEFAAEFIKGIVPQELTRNIEDTPLPLEVEPAQVKQKKPEDMTVEELRAAFRAKNDE